MSIVTVNVSTQAAPTPDTTQRKGAFISQGGTTLAAGTYQLLTSAADLTSILAAAVTNSALAWSGGTVTVTTATAHGYTTGDTVTVSGVTPTGYNGSFVITVTDSTHYTYALVSDPGLETVPGVSTDADVAQLTAMNTTFWAQGAAASVYVLELGHGTAAAGVTALSTFLTAHPNLFYSYLVPRGWDAESTFVTLIGTFTSDTAKTYFHVTATLSSYASFTGKKSVLMLIEASGIPATEFTAAARFYTTLAYRPSATNQVTPLSYAYQYGVTAYPATLTQQTTFATANLDYITTGAEGGISNTILALGVTANGDPFNYWYSVDWMQFTAEQALAAAVINGSNNALAPLYYDQNGINRLSNVIQGVGTSGVADGLALGPVTVYQMTAADFATFLTSGQAPAGVLVNAVPFLSYVTLHPTDYTSGIYGGLTLSYTPNRGFKSIVFNINVSNFVIQG